MHIVHWHLFLCYSTSKENIGTKILIPKYLIGNLFTVTAFVHFFLSVYALISNYLINHSSNGGACFHGFWSLDFPLF